MLAQQVQATGSTAGARTTKRVEQMLEEYRVSISFTLLSGHVFPYPSLSSFSSLSIQQVYMYGRKNSNLLVQAVSMYLVHSGRASITIRSCYHGGF